MMLWSRVMVEKKIKNKEQKNRKVNSRKREQGIKNAYKGLQERTLSYLLKTEGLKTYPMLMKMEITHIV